MNDIPTGEHSTIEQQLRTIAEPLPNIPPPTRVDWIHDSDRDQPMRNHAQR